MMYQFTFALCTFVLCISCANSAPSSPTLLSALLSPPSASAPSSSYETDAAVAPFPASQSDRRETGSTTYDQKQSGKYNIHLNIKDVAIIALDAGGDGGIGDAGQDYYEDYDIADFTVKPVFGLVEITSNKPSTNGSETLIHFEPDNWMANATSANKTETPASNGTAIEEPIIKDPKPQSVEILNESSEQSTTVSAVSSTAAPAIEASSPSHISHKQTPLPIQFPIQPDQIPVQVILDALPAAVQKAQLGRQRVNGGGGAGAIKSNWRLRNRATPSHHRRITPPNSGFEDSPYFAATASPAIGNNKYRKHSFSHQAQRRNCIVDQNGQCQNSQRQSFSSPTL